MDFRRFFAACAAVTAWCAISPHSSAEVLGAFDRPMTFAYVSVGGNIAGGEWISAMGVIEGDTPEKFKSFIATVGFKGRVTLHSPGGNLIAGMELGRLIREAGSDTSVGETIPDSYGNHTEIAGICASACAYAFFGGVNRSLDGDSVLGFHQFYKDATETAASDDAMLLKLGISADQFISGLLIAYAIEMGVDARILSVASATSSHDMTALSKEQLDALNVTTRTGFGDWWIEPFGEGIVAATRKLDSYSSERQITIYCRASDKTAIAMLSLERYSGWITPGEFYRMSQDPSVSVGGVEARVPKSAIEFVSSGEFDAVRIPIDPELMPLFTTAESLSVDVNGPHVFYNFGVHATTALTPAARKMIHLAFRNCV